MFGVLRACGPSLSPSGLIKDDTLFAVDLIANFEDGQTSQISEKYMSGLVPVQKGMAGRAQTNVLRVPAAVQTASLV